MLEYNPSASMLLVTISYLKRGRKIFKGFRSVTLAYFQCICIVKTCQYANGEQMRSERFHAHILNTQNRRHSQ